MSIRVAITASALAAGAALFIGTPGAIATQGQPVLAGAQNTETTETLIANTNQVSLSDCVAFNPFHDAGLVGCGFYGVAGRGSANGLYGRGSIGVLADGANTGVFASADASSGKGVHGVGGSAGTGVFGSTATGTGVFGQNTGSTGIGVHGKTGGVGSAVFGEATAGGIGVNGTSANSIAVRGVGGPTGVYGSGGSNGVEGVSPTGDGVLGRNTGSTGIGVHGVTGGTGSAVFGQATTNGVGINGTSATGLGVLAASTSGTALQVNGKAKFSRSGIVTVAAGSASTTVSLAGVTAASMVVATAQQNGSVFVKAAVPAGGSFKLFLNGNAPAGGLKVAYFVLN